MTYNHHKKAGNQGDCVKHPALIAALDEALKSTSNSELSFHYLDVFAGHAWHPLLGGKEYEWKKGIGKLAMGALPRDAPECVKVWWSIWHDAPEWPTTIPPGYPGSAWIAAHRCRSAERSVKLELYDRAEEVRRDLERAFPPSHDVQEDMANVCLIGQSMEPNTDLAVAADFVFIDPPGWQSQRNPQYPKWKTILDHVLTPHADGHPTLM
jgi:23S rRNA A2030 N6-methylase RlmJ